MGSDEFREEEIKFLKDQARRASSALRNVEEANKSLLARIEAAENDLRKSVDERNAGQRRLEEKESELSGLQAEIEQQQQEHVSGKHELGRTSDLAKILEDEIRELEEKSRIEDIELLRLESLKKDDDDFMRAAEEELLYYTNSIKSQQATIDSLVTEEDSISENILQLRERSKAELDQLEEDLKVSKNCYTTLAAELTEKEGKLRKQQKNSAELERILHAKEEELGRLVRLRDGDATAEDECLREMKEVDMRNAEINKRNEECLSQLEEFNQEMDVASKEALAVETEISAAEERLLEIEKQRLGLLHEKEMRQKEVDKIKSDLTSIDDKRSECITAISELETSLLSLNKQVKEETRKQHSLEAKMESLTRRVEEKSTEVRTSKNALEQRTTRLNTLLTQNEFMKHERDSLIDGLARSKKELEAVCARLIEEESKDVSEKVEAMRAENERMQAEIEKIEVELKFLAEHGMVGPDGLIRPLQIDTTVKANSLVEQLGINEFLVQAQAEPDLSKVIFRLVEKISELLQLIHEAESLEDRYARDVEKAEEIAKQLSLKNESILTDIERFKRFRKTALVQIGLNQMKVSNPSIIVLHKLEFQDEDLDDLLNRLVPEDKSRITKFDASYCQLRSFPLVRIVEEFVNLRTLDIRNNPGLETVPELERHLRSVVCKCV